MYILLAKLIIYILWSETISHSKYVSPFFIVHLVTRSAYACMWGLQMSIVSAFIWQFSSSLAISDHGVASLFLARSIFLLDMKWNQQLLWKYLFVHSMSHASTPMVDFLILPGNDTVFLLFFICASIQYPVRIMNVETFHAGFYCIHLCKKLPSPGVCQFLSWQYSTKWCTIQHWVRSR